MAGDPGRVFFSDIDETLVDFTSMFCRYHNENYGTGLSIEDFNTYFYHEVLRCSLDEAVERVRGFYDSPMFSELPLIDGALDGIRKLQDLGEVRCVTSRPKALDNVATITRELARDVFGICRVDFARGYLNPGLPSKTDILAARDGLFLVDDDPEVYNLDRARVILHRRPWNRGYRAFRWDEIPGLACARFPACAKAFIYSL